MNVLGHRFRDDIPTRLAAFERTVHDYENQSTKTVDDIRNSVRITSWNQIQYIDSQPLPMQFGANPKSKGKGRDKAKDVKNESSKKAKSDDLRKCLYCNKTGHERAECRQRLEDLC